MQNVVISPEQSRAARALLNLSAEQMRAEAGLGTNTLQRFERGLTSLNMSTVQKLVSTYNRLGVVFPDPDTVRRVPAPAIAEAA